MSEDTTDTTPDVTPEGTATSLGAASGRRRRTTAQRLRLAAVWTVGLAIYVWVMFTWVFPWAAEVGLSPSVEG